MTEFILMILNPYRVAAFLFVFSIFTAGSIPTAGQAFPGFTHWIAHFTVFALIALVSCIGWPKIKSMHISVIVIVIGVINELGEITTHRHGFEFRDAIVDGLGAVFGASILIAFWKLAQKSASKNSSSLPRSY